MKPEILQFLTVTCKRSATRTPNAPGPETWWLLQFKVMLFAAMSISPVQSAVSVVFAVRPVGQGDVALTGVTRSSTASGRRRRIRTATCVTFNESPRIRKRFTNCTSIILCEYRIYRFPTYGTYSQPWQIQFLDDARHTAPAYSDARRKTTHYVTIARSKRSAH